MHIQAQISITVDDLPHAGLAGFYNSCRCPCLLSTVGKASDQAQIWNYTKLDPMLQHKRLILNEID